MQRLHEDDLVGHVLAQEKWEVVSFPAIAEQDEEHLIDTPLGTRRFKRRAGDVLHPEREPREVLERTRATTGEYNFAGQYQQAPAPLGGGMIKPEWFKRYRPEDLPDRFDQIVQSWDTANKATELSDHSVCTTWGLKQDRRYLLHVLRRRMDYPELKRAVRGQWQLHRATVVLIEDKASGTQLIQDLINDGLNVTRYKPEGDKVMRMHAQTAKIENGFVYLPTEAPWLAEFLYELAIFPKGKYDDQVDSTSQALAWIAQGSSWTQAMEVAYRELALSYHHQGLPLAYIAGALNLPVSQITNWINDAPRIEQELTQIYDETRAKLSGERNCATCGKDPPLGTQFIEAGCRRYCSSECANKPPRVEPLNLDN